MQQLDECERMSYVQARLDARDRLPSTVLSCISHCVSTRHCIPRAIAVRAHVCRCAWCQLGLPAPGGMLICGPQGSGQADLAALLTARLSGHQQCHTHVVRVACSTLHATTLPRTLQTLAPAVREPRLLMKPMCICRYQLSRTNCCFAVRSVKAAADVLSSGELDASWVLAIEHHTLTGSTALTRSAHVH